MATREIVLAKTVEDAKALQSKLGAGVYELRGKMDTRLKSKDQLQAELRGYFAAHLQQEGLELVVLDYNLTIIRFQLTKKPANLVTNLSPEVTAQFVPIILTIAALVVLLFVTWKVVQEFKELVQIVLDSGNPVAVTYAAATGGFTLLLLGVGGWFVWKNWRGRG